MTYSRLGGIFFALWFSFYLTHRLVLNKLPLNALQQRNEVNTMPFPQPAPTVFRYLSEDSACDIAIDLVKVRIAAGAISIDDAMTEAVDALFDLDRSMATSLRSRTSSPAHGTASSGT